VNEYLTWQFLLTFSGAAIGVWLLTTVVQYLVGAKIEPYLKWVAFLASEGFSALYVAVNGTGAWWEWVIGLVNGLWLFATVVGINTQTTKTSVTRGPAAAMGMAGGTPEPRKFLKRW